jgi:hypothetical protein
VHSYTAFGLNVRSELPFPSLEPGEAWAEADVEIRLADLGDLRASLTAAGEHYRLSAGEVAVTSVQLGTFSVRGGHEILLDPAPGLDLDGFHVAVVTAPLAALLVQRGFLLLHGSAVVIDGEAVCFVGNSGVGKSTMAAAFHARGHDLVVDDVIAIRFNAGVPVVQPGFPQFKLWPDSLVALGTDPSQLPHLDPEVEKRAHRITTGFCSPEPLPLRRIYFLGWGHELRIEPLEQRGSFLKLSAHTYGVRWMHDLSGPAFFRERAELARGGVVRSLVRTRDLAMLDAVMDLVIQDCRADG